MQKNKKIYVASPKCAVSKDAGRKHRPANSCWCGSLHTPGAHVPLPQGYIVHLPKRDPIDYPPRKLPSGRWTSTQAPDHFLS